MAARCQEACLESPLPVPPANYQRRCEGLA
jgi:hypothetical protein